MNNIIRAVASAPKTRAQNDDDFADRLSSRYTVIQLWVFALLIGVTQVSYQISCCIVSVTMDTPSIVRTCKAFTHN
jgi:innexin